MSLVVPLLFACALAGMEPKCTIITSNPKNETTIEVCLKKSLPALKKHLKSALIDAKNYEANMLYSIEASCVPYKVYDEKRMKLVGAVNV